jgi:hypothetical protein
VAYDAVSQGVTFAVPIHLVFRPYWITVVPWLASMYVIRACP